MLSFTPRLVNVGWRGFKGPARSAQYLRAARASRRKNELFQCKVFIVHLDINEVNHNVGLSPQTILRYTREPLQFFAYYIRDSKLKPPNFETDCNSSNHGEPDKSAARDSDRRRFFRRSGRSCLSRGVETCGRRCA